MNKSEKLKARILLIAVLCLLFTLGVSPGWSAESDSVLTQTSEYLLQEVSQDISEARAECEKVLLNFPLSSSDVKARETVLAQLMQTASDDAGQWSFSEEERKNYAQLLNDLDTAYSRFETLRHSRVMYEEQTARENATTSGDAVPAQPSVPTVTSTDINEHDKVRQNLEKQNKWLDIQLFSLRNTLNKITIYLEEVKQGEIALDGITGSDVAQDIARHIQGLQLELSRVRLASAIQTLQEGSLRNRDLIQAIKSEQSLLNSIRSNLSFTEELLNKNIEALQEEAARQKKQIVQTKQNLARAAVALEEARQDLSEDAASTAELTPEGTRYSALLADLNRWEYSLTLIQDTLNWLDEAQAVWAARYKLFNNEAKGDEIWNYRNRSQSKIAELKARNESIQSLQDDYQTRISTLSAEVEKATGKVKQNLLQLLQTLQDTISTVFTPYSVELPKQILLEQMLYEEAGARLDTLRLAEQVGSFSKKTFLSFWNTVLWSGEGYSVTISKLVLALLLMFFSFFLSNRGSRWIQRRMLRRLSVNPTAAAFAQRLIFYVLWLMFFIIALQLVRIPLTAFAFLGGAAALAIGFGAQNLFNNLISGFIIIFSRPFSVKDIVEVDGIAGTVEEIGSRSTRIKTWENVDVILPNRYLLENQVSNWTGGDSKKRETLTIRVGYESDSRQVEELILKVARTHSRVLKDPQPFVTFQDFGENALIFTLYYWVDLETSSGLKVGSDMRHHLISLFRSEGVSIPYPRREVLLVNPAPPATAEFKETQETVGPSQAD
ncbi:MAG: mechanosensitive ion channel [Fretibacterium sp.]|nr:mechanosensitive ion channel [Fretibacterium sp.]